SRFLEEIKDENIDGLIGITRESKGFGEPKILGNFKPLKPKTASLNINPDDFSASPISKIIPGARVLHLKFGEGQVLSVDDRQIATILFSDAVDSPEKRIVLKFAKLQVLE
ncbi:MAG: ATP-dependent DNA helicase, partial [Saprospiraceae bacterium]|nr:ATP-dependent DNA helicase [Saprospiraceae bacterium]